MYAYVLFCVSDHRYDDEIASFTDLAKAALPTGFDPLPSIHRQGDFVLVYWHVRNDKHGVLVRINPGAVTSPNGDTFFASGYLAKGMVEENEKKVFSIVQQDAGGIRLVESTGGVSSNSWISSSGKVAHCWSTQPPAIPTFFAKNRQGFCVVGNRPRLTYMASVLSNGYAVDRSYLSKYIASGFAFDGITPYPGTAAVPPNKSILLRDGDLAIVDYPLAAPDEIPQDLPLEEKGAALAGLLREATWPARAIGRANLFLSGGKDSRVIACALNGTTKISAFTTGPESGGEADVARPVAEAIGAPYTVRRQMITADAIKAAAASNLMSDGLGSAFAHQFNFRQDLDFLEWLPSFHGHGHLLRGGFGRRMRQTNQEMRDALNSAFLSPFATETAISGVRSGIDQWVGHREKDFRDARDILFYSNMDYRLGLFSAPASLEMTWRTFMVYPLLDERIARFAAGLSVFDRISERVVFAAMRILSRDLTNFPLYGEMWRFDREPERTDYPDSNHNFQEGFELRQPAKASKHVTIKLSESFSYDADKGHVEDSVKAKSRFILDSSVRKELDELVQPFILDEVSYMANAGQYSSDYWGRDPNTRQNIGSFINRVFIGATLYDLRW